MGSEDVYKRQIVVIAIKINLRLEAIYYKKVQNGCIIAIIVVQPGVLISF